MGKKLIITAKTALTVAILLLAIVSSLYVLGIYEDAVAVDALLKLTKILGIFTGAFLLLTVISCCGGKTPPSC